MVPIHATVMNIGPLSLCFLRIQPVCLCGITVPLLKSTKTFVKEDYPSEIEKLRKSVWLCMYVCMWLFFLGGHMPITMGIQTIWNTRWNLLIYTNTSAPYLCLTIHITNYQIRFVVNFHLTGIFKPIVKHGNQICYLYHGLCQTLRINFRC